MGSINKKLNGHLKSLWQISKDISLPEAPNSEEAWELLEQRLDIEDHREVASNIPPKPKLILSQPKLGFALALVVLAILFGPSVYRWVDTKSIISARGMVLSNTLPDGSQITLNAESQISYRSNFGRNTRNVVLAGEAFFDVEKGEIPFTIHAGKVSISVVGTEFNVRSRNGRVAVAVHEGIVKVTSQDSTITLQANQMTSLSQGDFPSASKPLPFAAYPRWTQNQLMFHE
ncbi:FecR domain-containing protein, partial [Caldithrix abyssi]|nr:FecR domain-containing protein [Caldithrix abyssi]